MKAQPSEKKSVGCAFRFISEKSYIKMQFLSSLVYATWLYSEKNSVNASVTDIVSANKQFFITTLNSQ